MAECLAQQLRDFAPEIQAMAQQYPYGQCEWDLFEVSRRMMAAADECPDHPVAVFA